MSCSGLSHGSHSCTFSASWALPSDKGLIRGGSPKIKILARGEVGKALTVKAHKFSGKAAEKIAAAGGATEQLA